MTTIQIYTHYVGNSAVMALGNLMNRATRAPITDADGVTITAQIYRLSDNTVVAGGPLVFTYNATTKEWIGVIPSDYALVKGVRYDAQITMDGGTQLKGFEHLPFDVKDRYAGQN